MRILYIGSLSKTACATFYLGALKTLGHSVQSYDPGAFETTTFLEKVKVRFSKSPLPNKTAQIGKDIIQLCRETPFDVVLVIAENFLPDVWDEIRAIRSPAPKFIYHSHDNNFSDGILKPKYFFETLKKYDRLFTTKSQNVKKYKDLGNPNSYFIPSAFEPLVHHPVRHSKNTYAVSFVGTYDYSRDKFLASLDWKELYVWGNNWKRYKRFRKHKDHIVPHAIYLEDYAEVVSDTKISLGLLREEAEDLHTQRTFEIPACGSFQLAPRNDEILSFFEEGKEIECFGSIEELKSKTEYYLKHDSERQKIAKAGFDKCISEDHSYLSRVRTMLKTLP